MGWPTPQEYNEAIQNPLTAFADPELRSGKPVLTPLGLPRPITGAFASVYQLACAGGRTVAVRCFLREFGDQQERYAAISAHLATQSAASLSYMTNFTYLARGIRVNGRWYPVLKMDWLEGESLQSYVEHNLNRPVKMQRIWVGELEVIADRVYYVTDVYTWADALSPGRLFLSIKTGLRDVNYPGTVVGQFYYSLEALIALYLTVTKARAEHLLGRELRQVVLGRPVHWASDAAGDRVAEARLLHAAFLAGYETVYLQYEPVAAAYSYALGLSRPENALVFDFGGGTLDITVMRLGEDRPRVLATGGIPVAGDVFDQKLVRAKLPRHFGEGSLYGPRHKALTTPQWIYDSFNDWQTILQLNSPQNRQVLRDIAQTAQHKHQIEALLALISSNYGLKMFDVVEAAKRALSDKRGAEIHLDGPGFSVREFVTRGEFEDVIRAETRAIEHHLIETVQRSGLRPEQIDTVIRTGGSALIPAFYDMLGRHFGEARVRSIDAFSSVTAGLGVIAHHLERGEVELPAHTTADFANLPEPTGGRLKVRPVNLELLQRRIVLEEQGSGEAGEQGSALVLLGKPVSEGEWSRAAVVVASAE